MISSELQKTTSALIRRCIFIVMAWITPAAPVAGYLVGLSLGLPAEETIWAVSRILPPVFLIGGIVIPWSLIAFLVRRAFAENPGEPPEHRLERILRLPWKVAGAGVQLAYLFGGVFFTSPVVLLFKKSPVLIGLGLLIAISFGVVLSIPVGIKIEQLLMPFAIAERNRLGRRIEGSGFFWPRQSWYLPYAFSTSLVTTLALGAAVVVLQTLDVRDSQVQAILSSSALPHDQAQLIAAHMRGFSEALLAAVRLPVAALGAFILVVPSFSAWMLARRQADAAAAVQQAIEGLAAGRPTAPAWASTDEIGDLASGMVTVLQRLQEIPSSLSASAQRLSEAGLSLGSASNDQRQSLSQQAAALQEAHVTSQEIRHTSELAAQKADAVLNVVSRAERLGQSGESALEQTLTGLGTARHFVDEIRARVSRLEERARQISNIVTIVKSLADRSNMLALNAAIEAVRSGEHGKGFSVVAREIRALADQSIRETVRIRDVLEEVSSAIREVATMSEQGSEQVAGGLEQVKSSGDSLRELSQIIQENAAAVRQIAAAVSQQNTGVSQIFIAIGQLSSGMDETVKRLDTTLEATKMLETATQDVEAVAQRYQFKD